MKNMISVTSFLKHIRQSKANITTKKKELKNPAKKRQLQNARQRLTERPLKNGSKSRIFP